jgi:hypothetical protein
MQMFKRPVQTVQAGERAGICVTKLDPDLLERGLAAAHGTVPTFSAAVAQVEKIRFYPGRVQSKSKVHVIVGHQTVMADLTFFGVPAGKGWTAEGGWHVGCLGKVGGGGGGGGLAGGMALPSTRRCFTC